MIKYFWLFLLPLNVFGQFKDSAVTLSGYVETYYVYDFNNSANHQLPPFLYNFNRHSEMNLNLGLIKAGYYDGNIRGNFGLMAGTYALSNLAGEPPGIRNIWEANVGFKIGKKNFWFDAGIFPSHIGFESAIGQDNLTLTRSLAAENSPYYEAGGMLSYTTDNNKINVCFLVLNGWQRIFRTHGYNRPAIGSHINYDINENIGIYYSNYLGNELPDNLNGWRFFNNIYMKLAYSKFFMNAGFDIGFQNAFIERFTWYTPIVKMKYQVTERSAIALRGEYYTDPDEVIVATPLGLGFNTWSTSLGYDLKIRKNVMWRGEAKYLESDQKLYSRNKKPVNSLPYFTTSVSIKI